jgi:archaellum component FlaC
VSWYYVFDLGLLTDIYSERYLKKLIGNVEIEDALQELDKLTQEEALMASAELLKVTHGVDDRVKDVDERVQEVGGDVQDVGKRMQGIDSNVKDMTDKVQGVDDKVQDVHDEVQAIDNKLNKVNRSSSHYFPFLRSVYPDILTGHQLRDSLLRWLSPPDPSTTHNIACKSRHNSTAQWFFQGSIFNQWKSNGSFLWLYGIRAFHLVLYCITTSDHLPATKRAQGKVYSGSC